MREKVTDIDIGLDALCKQAKPGQTLTQRQIADVCGCSKSAIYLIEKSAKAKIKRAVLRKHGSVSLLLNDERHQNTQQNLGETHGQ